MDEVAASAGISRALLYQHFATKRDLFAGVYQQAADGLLEKTRLDPAGPLEPQVVAGLDAHIDYFVANRNAVLAANRTLAGDPVISTIIATEMDVLRQRLLEFPALHDESAELAASVLMSWLVFVRVLCVEWLDHGTSSRQQVRDVCVGALIGALHSSKSAP